MALPYITPPCPDDEKTAGGTPPRLDVRDSQDSQEGFKHLILLLYTHDQNSGLPPSSVPLGGLWEMIKLNFIYLLNPWID